MGNHTATRRGRKVYVILNTGEHLVDRFVTRTPGKHVVLEKRGRIPCSEIRSLSDFWAKAGQRPRWRSV